MARLTRAENRALTKERLLDAAAGLFAERGVNGTSLEQIAERAGYTRGAIYSNFPDKNAIAHELLLRRTHREAEEVRALGGDFDALRRWNRDRAEHLPAWMALRLELVLHALRDPGSRPPLAERETFARSTIAEGLAAGGTADADFLALIIHALEDGLLIQHLLNPDAVPADIVVDAVEHLLGRRRATGVRETATPTRHSTPPSTATTPGTSSGSSHNSSTTIAGTE
ncbi:TetR family transcriptional regulator [Actinosynnema sp. NPDC023587]|uniref:TetR/AcrR family transcriptional regulator n=1 Tax=Actinosynnema sp. NPDC023587 TaxID=3154695 RepID=UPI00340747B7